MVAQWEAVVMPPFLLRNCQLLRNIYWCTSQPIRSQLCSPQQKNWPKHSIAMSPRRYRILIESFLTWRLYARFCGDWISRKKSLHPFKSTNTLSKIWVLALVLVFELLMSSPLFQLSGLVGNCRSFEIEISGRVSFCTETIGEREWACVECKRKSILYA